MEPNLHDCKKILIVCPIGIGNFLMAQPAIENLAQKLGSDRLTLLALKPGIAEMGHDSGLFSEVIPFYPDKESLLKGMSSLLALRAKKYDATISLFPTGHWKYSLFTRIIGAPHRIGFSYPNSNLPKRLQTYTCSSNFEFHDTDQNLNLIEQLLGSTEYRGFRYPGKVVLKENPHDRYYVCHPGSSAERGMDKKRFDPRVYAATAVALYKAFSIRCYLAGDPTEAHIRSAVADEITRIISGDTECVGITADTILVEINCRSLGELSGIIAESLFYIGNDSGLMHMSVAEEKRCIVFFGPTDEKRTGPFYVNQQRLEGEHLIIREESLSCAPCWNYKSLGANRPCIFGDYRCTTQFDPMTRWDEIRSFASEIVG
ncbi:MAG: glycosyltransferase family 9 protein [Fibrobacterales bacterium]